MTNEQSVPLEPQAPNPLKWDVRLGSEQPTKQLVVFLAAICAGIVGFLLLHQWLVAVIGFLAIIASTTELFFRTKYRLDSEGARAQCGMSVTSMDWVNVKRVIPDEVGVLLSPLEKSGRLDAFRGVYLRFAGNREEVLAKIREFTNGDE